MYNANMYKPQHYAHENKGSNLSGSFLFCNLALAAFENRPISVQAGISQQFLKSSTAYRIRVWRSAWSTRRIVSYSIYCIFQIYLLYHQNNLIACENMQGLPIYTNKSVFVLYSCVHKYAGLCHPAVSITYLYRQK